MDRQDSSFSDAAFGTITTLLASDAAFRREFCSDPEQAVRDAGISLRREELNALHKIESISSGEGIETFDERLVLCSSSGY